MGSSSVSYCSGLNSVPSKIHVYLKPQNMTLVGNRVVADVIRSYEIRVGLDLMTGVLLRRKSTETDTKRENFT